jgi:hypothetical protein
MEKIKEFPSTARLLRNQVNVMPGTVFIVIVQLCFICSFTLLAPLFIRHLFAVPFVELNEPLEFTFHTCTDQLQ